MPSQRPHTLSGLLSLLLLGSTLAIPAAQQAGLDAATPVLPFFNGVFPDQTPQDGSDWQLVDAFPGISFDEPMFLSPVPGTNRLMLAEKDGILKVFDNAESTDTITTLIDLSDQVEGGGDSGFFSFAFHPEFGQTASPSAQFLYVYYRYTPDTDEGDKAYCRLSRLTWDPALDSIDPASEYVLIQQYDRQGWHNGGGLLFGNEGFLYVTIGDEGGQNDLYDAAQKLDVGLLSGVFRIDVDQIGGNVSHPIRRHPENPSEPPSGWPDSFSQGYFIPSDNPWLDPDGSMLEEYWALGVRSPHRMTIDRPTGDIYLGDVGQWAREEVSLVVAGANLQWPYREGNIDGAKTKPASLIGFDHPPLIAYGDDEGSCVIGGYVYRGQLYDSSLRGKYIFGDYSSGSIWAVTRNGETVSRELLGNADLTVNTLSSFGIDGNDELYILTLPRSGESEGRINKLTRTGPTIAEAPTLLSATGVFSDLTALTPAAGLIPYRVNSPLWSDGAAKQRWIAIPNDGTPNSPGEQIVYSETGNWSFPQGTVIVKQFTLAGRHLETRFLIHGDDGAWYGITYRWREDQSDADLLLTGEEDTLQIGGGSHHWSFPSRSDCLQCHTASSGRVLGLRTRQLNGDLYYPSTGRVANQLQTLNQLGFFSEPIAESSIPGLLTSAAVGDSNASVEHRARSYLDSNCAHCHNPAEGIRAFDFRLSTPLELAGVLNAPIQNTFGVAGAKEVAPGDAWRSMAWLRQNTSELGQKMPPLGRHTIDTEAVNLIYNWIESLERTTIPTPNGLMAYIPFEDVAAGIANDLTGNGNDGQFVDAATSTDGHTGSGLATGANDGLLRITHSADIHLGANNADFTVSFWVNLQEGFTGEWRGLAGKGIGSHQRAIGIYLKPGSNKMDISVSTTEHYNEGLSSSSELPIGEWTHLAIVKEGLDLSLYLDGQLDRDTTLSGNSVGTVEDFHLGRGPGSADRVDALYDSLHIFNRALSASEVQEIGAVDDIAGHQVEERSLFDLAAGNAGLSGADALPEASPFGDDSANIIKYAFNLDLSTRDSHWMEPGGTSGLPVASLFRDGEQRLWRMEFVRRRASGLVYSPVKSNQLAEGTFVPMTGTQTVNPIDETWEHVVIEEPVTDVRFFSKVDVTLP